MSFLSSINKKTQRGFSLIEMMVSLAIMMTIISVVAFNQNKYSAASSLKILANEVSLSLRQAQIYGISVRGITDDFSLGYGMAMSTVGGNNNQYIFFADKGTKNKYYDGTWSCLIGPTYECQEKVVISNGNTISDLCVISNANVDTCGLGRIDISFIRPKTQANFIFFNSSLVIVNYADVQGAKIKFTSKYGDTRFVTVYGTGQISVQ